MRERLQEVVGEVAFDGGVNEKAANGTPVSRHVPRADLTCFRCNRCCTLSAMCPLAQSGPTKQGR
jgi:hypothetical protein